MKKKIIIAIIALAVVGVMGYILAGNMEKAKSKPYISVQNKSVIVKVETVAKQALNIDFAYSGTFIPYREVMIIPQTQGEVTGVYFKEGQTVTKGSLLAKIDDNLLHSQLIGTKATFENARINYERYKNASNSEGVSKMQIDASLLQLKTAESQLKQTEVAIKKCEVRAPFRGIITKRDVELGSSAGANPIARLTDISSLKLEVIVPESNIPYFKQGQSAQITTDVYPGQVYHGVVDFVSASADQSHNYIVKLLVPNNTKNQLKGGMYGNVTFSKQMNVNALLIPRTSLVGSSKKAQAYVMENGVAKLRNLEIGRTNGTLIEVVSGLSEGEKIITTGIINLVDGSKVELAK